MPIRIPDQHVPPLRDLVEFQEEKYEIIEDALAQWEPSLELEDLIESLSSELETTETETASFLSVLVNIYSLQYVHEIPLDEIFQEIFERIDRIQGKDEGLSEEHKESFRTFIEDISSLDQTLGVMAKGLGLVEEGERIFSDSRVISDLRPIFRPDTETDIIASAVRHNLRISYRARVESQVDDFYVALNDSDLRELKKEIERALAKTKAIREGGIGDVPILTGGDDE